MTKKIIPQFTGNRSAGNAYGCGCCCNKQWGNFEQARSAAKNMGNVCGCTCIGYTNHTANSDLAYENLIFSL